MKFIRIGNIVVNTERITYIDLDFRPWRWKEGDRCLRVHFDTDDSGEPTGTTFCGAEYDEAVKALALNLDADLDDWQVT